MTVRFTGPRECRVCNMPRGLEPDRAFIMGFALSRKMLHVTAMAGGVEAWSVTLALCPKHDGMLKELGR